jgi:hypothetical protein
MDPALSREPIPARDLALTPVPTLAGGAPHLLHMFCRRAPPSPTLLVGKRGRMCTTRHAVRIR